MGKIFVGHLPSRKKIPVLGFAGGVKGSHKEMFGHNKVRIAVLKAW